MSRLLAIDPGTFESGFVVFQDGKVHASGILKNEDILHLIVTRGAEFGEWCSDLAIEMVASYGMPVGAEVFETVVWIGRFQQQWFRPKDVKRVKRKDIKIALCGTSKAKDANIRQRLIDMVGPQGVKANPGPTYGVKSHAWAALAVAVALNELACAQAQAAA